MNLDEAQKQKVAAWINEGLKLSEIQNRLASEFGIRLTYMEVRLLVDDLKLMPKDPEPAAGPTVLATPGPSPAGARQAPGPAATQPTPTAPAPSQVQVTVDEITRPGALVSGSVTFRNGKRADWYLDQHGRLGLIPEEQGYRPSAADVEEFQTALEDELNRLGL
jgi:hypothetical protein